MTKKHGEIVELEHADFWFDNGHFGRVLREDGAFVWRLYGDTPLRDEIASGRCTGVQDGYHAIHSAIVAAAAMHSKATPGDD